MLRRVGPFTSVIYCSFCGSTASSRAMLFLSFPLHIWADERLHCRAHRVRESATRILFLLHLQVFPGRLDSLARLPSWQDLCVVCPSASSKLGTSFKGTMGKGAASSSKNAPVQSECLPQPCDLLPHSRGPILENRSRVSLEQAGWPHPPGGCTGPAVGRCLHWAQVGVTE